jgi:hypothetical protein
MRGPFGRYGLTCCSFGRCMVEASTAPPQVPRGKHGRHGAFGLSHVLLAPAPYIAIGAVLAIAPHSSPAPLLAKRSERRTFTSPYVKTGGKETIR